MGDESAEIFDATSLERNRTHDLLHLPSSSSILGPLDSDSVESSKLSVRVLDEVLGGDGVLCRIGKEGKGKSQRDAVVEIECRLLTSRIVAEVSRDLSVSVIDSEDSRVGRQWVVAS